MQKFLASKLIEVGQIIGLIHWAVGDDEKHTRTDQEEQQLREDLTDLNGLCRNLEMKVSAELIEKWLTSVTPKTETEYALFRSVMNIELDAKNLLYIPVERARYFEKNKILSAAAKKAFPSAFIEVMEAGCCYGAGRYVATVLHSMRAAEIGVKAMARELGYSPENLDQMDWHPVLEKCEALIQELRDTMKKGPQKESDLKFYSQAAAQFRHFKDGWRVQAAHARPPFSDGEARAILDATISFYELMSERLSENPSAS